MVGHDSQQVVPGVDGVQSAPDDREDDVDDDGADDGDDDVDNGDCARSAPLSPTVVRRDAMLATALDVQRHQVHPKLGARFLERSEV